MPSALDRFEAIVPAGSAGEFARLALDVALALARAADGAIVVRVGAGLQVLASTLSAAKSDKLHRRLGEGSDGACGARAQPWLLLPFAFGPGATGLLCLEEARDPAAAEKVAQVLARRFSLTDAPPLEERRAS